MRKEKDVLSEKNVHHRAIAAEGRVRSNGREHHTLHVPKPFAVDEDTVTLWERIRQLFPSPEKLIVAGRVINKGIVLTPTMALTLFLAMAGMVGTMYYRMSDTIASQSQTISSQNELLIRLDQRLLDKNDHDNQRFQKLEGEFESVHAWQQVTNKDLAQIKAKQ